MLPMSPLLLGALLLSVLLGLAAALVWQEAKQRAVPDPITYVLEDAVRFVSQQAVPSDLSEDDIRRILEWEVVYLQGISPRGAGKLEPVRVGNSEEAARFILDQIGQPARYSEDDVRLVLAGEAAYLASIGALGAAIEGGSP